MGVAALLALAALAAADAIRLPPWPLSPDGEVVAVAGDAPLRSRDAAVEPLAPGLYRVRPLPGVERVQLEAGEHRASAAVEPPAGRVLIEANPASPVKGRD